MNNEEKITVDEYIESCMRELRTNQALAQYELEVTQKKIDKLKEEEIILNEKIIAALEIETILEKMHIILSNVTMQDFLKAHRKILSIDEQRQYFLSKGKGR
jgi:hypothetical protein